MQTRREHLKHLGLGAVLAFSATARAAAEPADAKPGVLGILGAMSIEVEELQRQLLDRKEETHLGIRFETGTLNGRRVVLARSGIGSVNAAVATALMIEHYRPKHVLFTGIAGGLNPELGPCDIVIATKTTYNDFGELTDTGFKPFATVSPVDGKDNPLEFPADPVLLAAAEKAAKGFVLDEVDTPRGKRKPRIVLGTVLTGDQFVASAARREALRKQFKADATEMEGAAVAQICWQNQAPCLVIRSLSDEAGTKAMMDYKRFEKIAANNSARLVMRILKELDSK